MMTIADKKGQVHLDAYAFANYTVQSPNNLQSINYW